MIKGAFRFFWVGAFCTWFLAPSELVAESKPERIYRKVLPAVMTLEVDNLAGERYIGSAVLALGDDVAITAWHVVSDARSVWAIFADGTRLRVKGCIDRDSQRDLALLKLERPLPGRKAILSPRLQAVATRTFVIGAPKGYGFSISDGLVSQFREVDGVSQYQISCPISPGNSGGPVLNERGEVIGIASWTKADAQNLSFAIATRELEHLNPKKTVADWAESSALTGRSPLALPRRASSAVPAASSIGTNSVNQGPSDALPGFESFAERLERSTGRPITVIVQEDGKQSTYRFTVPPRPTK
jgi:hypothetical protein